MIKIVILIICISTVWGQIGGLMGGKKELDLKDPKVKEKITELATYGLEQIGLKRAEELAKEKGFSEVKPLNYSLLRIHSAQSQIVAGVMYYINFRMKENDGQDVEVCNIKVWEKKWENFTQLTDFNCKKKHSLFGANQKISNDDEYALNALNFAVDRLNQKSNDLFHQKISKVDKVYRQIVNGVKYTVEFKLASTKCQKNQKEVNLKTCSVEPEAKVQSYKVTVLDQPWMNENRYQLMTSEIL